MDEKTLVENGLSSSRDGARMFVIGRELGPSIPVVLSGSYVASRLAPDYV
ncbi:MAG: hypothetical protein RIC14_08155 [Filomicrobium sp.]